MLLLERNKENNMAEENTEGTITTPLGSVNLKGKKTAELIAIICLALLFLLSYVLWEHKTDEKESKKEFVGAFKELTAATRENVQAQRVMNCLLATDQKDREAKLSTCERLAR